MMELLKFDPACVRSNGRTRIRVDRIVAQRNIAQYRPAARRGRDTSTNVCNGIEDGMTAGGDTWSSVAALERLDMEQPVFDEGLKIGAVQLHTVRAIHDEHEGSHFMQAQHPCLLILKNYVGKPRLPSPRANVARATRLVTLT
ncbi:hypothetical protein [Cupriavidus sp. BIC8F]|uniref:hypothetical protein n=1 Tax=Cupriavidus sp. BIC8F TaxID=3079014 RepID=UPI00291657AB|nr:hypothetical protein [Cupriavidus sp. BIC8F]